MGYYDDIYTKRVNRFGTDFKTRIQGEREYAFENYLNNSIYRIDFIYNTEEYAATFEPYKQDESQSLHYLLTQHSVDIPNGTILSVAGDSWMIYWKEDNQDSGYNKYVMLKMSHTITWKTKDKVEHTSLAYLFGQENNALRDELKSKANNVVYNENNKLNYLIMPANEFINKDIYFTITTTLHEGETTECDITQGYRVTGFDILSTKGIEYVSIDPMYLKDETAAPVQPAGDTSNDYFWINMGEQ